MHLSKMNNHTDPHSKLSGNIAHNSCFSTAIKQQRQKRTQKKEDEEDTVTMSYGRFK